MIKIIKIQLISTFFAFFLPGDIVAGGITWHLLSKGTDRKAQIANVVVYLRLLNLVTLIPFGIFGFASERALISIGIQYYILIISSILIIFILPFIFFRAAKIFQRSIEYIIDFINLRQVKDHIHNICNALIEFSQISFSKKAVIILTSFIISIVAIIWFYMAVRISKMDIPYLTNLWLVPVVTLIHALPITINGTGLREVTIVTVLNRLYDVRSEKSIILSLIILFTGIFFGLLGGLLLLFNKKGSTSEQNGTISITP